MAIGGVQAWSNKSCVCMLRLCILALAASADILASQVLSTEHTSLPITTRHDVFYSAEIKIPPGGGSSAARWRVLTVGEDEEATGAAVRFAVANGLVETGDDGSNGGSKVDPENKVVQQLEKNVAQLKSSGKPKRRARVLIATRHMALNGANIWAYQLATALVALGHSVSVAGGEEGALSFLFASGAPSVRLHYPSPAVFSRGDWAAGDFLHELTSTHEYDIVIANTLSLGAFVSGFAARGHAAKLLWLIHETTDRATLHAWFKGVLRMDPSRIPDVLAAPHRVIFCSDETRALVSPWDHGHFLTFRHSVHPLW